MEHLVSQPHFNPSPTRSLVAAVSVMIPRTSLGGLLNSSSKPAELSRQDRPYSYSVSEVFKIQGAVNDLTKALTNTYITLVDPPVKANNYWTLDGNGGVKSSIKLDHTLDLPLIWNQDGSAWYLQQMDQSTGKQGLFQLA